MKSIIIAGVSRAGKSTLAKRIARNYQMTYIPFDCIVSTLENLYPQIEIAHRDENTEMSKNIAVFIKEFIKHLEYEDINYVLDLYQVFPDDLMGTDCMDTHVVAYIGYPTLSTTEKLKHVRKHARDKDWTKRVCDKEMEEILSMFIAESRLMQKQCAKNNIAFFDTGIGFENVLYDAYNYITQNMNPESF